MLSGNGRHRRPRQAPALLVAAGVTGSAIAIPLLGASGASAADGSTWDSVAECETGGAWSANHGYGEYGGLRLSQTDWESYGGLDYAPSPDQASRQQQIAVAERVLADQGVAAWPTCGPLVGLGEDTAPADVDTGVAEDAPLLPGLTGGGSGSSGSSGSSDSTDPSPSPSLTTDDPSAGETGTNGTSGATATTGVTGAGEADDPGNTTKRDTSSDLTSGSTADPGDGLTASPSPGATQESGGAPSGTSPDDSDNSGRNTLPSDTSTEPGTGRHRGSSAEEGVDGSATDGRGADSTGRHASRSGADVRDAADGEYVVREGDSLWGIADSLELEGGWSELYAANRETVGADPDLIIPGQTLAVGVETGEK